MERCRANHKRLPVAGVAYTDLMPMRCLRWVGHTGRHYAEGVGYIEWED